MLFNDGNIHFKILHLRCERNWPLQLRGNSTYSGLKENNYVLSFPEPQVRGSEAKPNPYFTLAAVQSGCRELLTLCVPGFHPTIHCSALLPCFFVLLPSQPGSLPPSSKICHVLGLVGSYVGANWSARSPRWLTRQLLPSGENRLFQPCRCPLSDTNLL